MHKRMKEDSQMMKRVYLLMSITNLVVGCSFGYFIIYQYTIYTIINTYVVLTCLVDIPKTRNYTLHKLFNVLLSLSRLITIIGFFILLCNVFVLDIGVRSCDSCAVGNLGIIITSVIYLLFYLVFVCLYIGLFIVNSNAIQVNI